ncbi:MAG: type II secretion system F family protein [Thermoguttaceae bacterium]|nr:type II secretion system F family protein [Thermoguttaceae bacterium]
MPKFKVEAVDSAGKGFTDVIEASTEEEVTATLKESGYMVTKIALHKDRKATKKKGGNTNGKTFSFGRVKPKILRDFTRNLSILQDAGLPILRSLNILQAQSKPGALRNCLIDVCSEIESGSSLSEAMAKSPKAFNRLYVNMIKAGEAGGALETILQRLAEFLERSEQLKAKIKSAMTYPVSVLIFSCGIMIFIMTNIVPKFEEIFADFDTELPALTKWLMNTSHMIMTYWYLIPGVPFGIWLFIKITTSFSYMRFGWHLFLLRVPIFGILMEKTVVARTTRTLGTLVQSGVPILEAIHITKETSDNAVFELMYQRILDAIREGDTIANPMKKYSRPGFHPACLFYFFVFLAGPIGCLIYMTKLQNKILDDIVVNMVDVGEETGELDEMLYKVADVFDEEVAVYTEALMSMIEPLLIMFLGGMVGTIVIALFLPMIKLIESLSQ